MADVKTSIVEDQAYEQYVDFLATRRSKELFNNKGASHAISVIKTIFKYAQNKVFIFSGSMSGEPLNNNQLVASAKTYLERGGIVKVLLEDTTQTSTFKTLLEEFSLKENEQVSIKTAPAEFIEKIQTTNNGHTAHFIIADGQFFRFETETTEYKALCGFNSPDLVEKLDSIFTHYFNAAESI